MSFPALIEAEFFDQWSTVGYGMAAVKCYKYCLYISDAPWVWVVDVGGTVWALVPPGGPSGPPNIMANDDLLQPGILVKDRWKIVRM